VIGLRRGGFVPFISVKVRFLRRYIHRPQEQRQRNCERTRLRHAGLMSGSCRGDHKKLSTYTHIAVPPLSGGLLLVEVSPHRCAGSFFSKAFASEPAEG